MELDWPRAAQWTERVLREIFARPIEPGLFYNVNLPHLAPDEAEPEIVFCPLDPSPLPLSYRHDANGEWHYDGDYHTRQRVPGADVEVCFGGRIAVTALRLF
jgi:5'-nucleotidase